MSLDGAEFAFERREMRNSVYWQAELPTSYNLNDVLVGASRQQQDLGVTLTEDLSWADHVQQVSGEATKLVYLMERSFRGCSQETCCTLYKTYP